MWRPSSSFFCHSLRWDSSQLSSKLILLYEPLPLCIMSRNKNEGSSHRLKTLESLYTCGRDHGIPQRPEGSFGFSKRSRPNWGKWWIGNSIYVPLMLALPPFPPRLSCSQSRKQSLRLLINKQKGLHPVRKRSIADSESSCKEISSCWRCGEKRRQKKRRNSRADWSLQLLPRTNHLKNLREKANKIWNTHLKICLKALSLHHNASPSTGSFQMRDLAAQKHRPTNIICRTCWHWWKRISSSY